MRLQNNQDAKSREDEHGTPAGMLTAQGLLELTEPHSVADLR